MNYCIVVLAALAAVAAAQHGYGWGNAGFGPGGGHNNPGRGGGRGGFGGTFPGADRGGFGGGGTWPGFGGVGPNTFPGMSPPPSELPDIQQTDPPYQGPVVGWTQNPDVTEGLFGFGPNNPGFGPKLPGPRIPPRNPSVGGRNPSIPGRGPFGGSPGVGRNPTFGRNPTVGRNPGVGGRRPGTGWNFFTGAPPTQRPRGRTVPARRVPTVTEGYNPGVYGRGRGLGPFLMEGGAAKAVNHADESYSSGQVAGIVIGVLFLIGIAGVIGVVVFKKHRQSSYSSHTDSA